MAEIRGRAPFSDDRRGDTLTDAGQQIQNFIGECWEQSIMDKIVPTTLVSVLVAAAFGCSSQSPQEVRKSAADGGPEDPAIFAVEKLGGSCFRASWVRETLVERDRFWFQEVEGDPVICVCLDDCANPGALLPRLSQLPHLQDLCLRRTPLTDEDARTLSALKELRRLRLENTRMTSAGLRQLARLEHLQDLNLDSNEIDDDGLKELTALRQLRVLRLRGDRITDAGLRHLASLDRLQRVHLWDTSVSDAGVAELTRLGDLSELALGRAKITGRGLRHLAKIASLESLDLSGTAVDSADLRELSTLVRLKELRLAYATSVTDASLDALARLPQLASLDLSSTQVTDAGLRPLSHLPTLDHLNLCSTTVTDEGLMELTRLRSLRSVWVIGTKVTASGLRRFESAHGNCSGMIDR